MPSLNTTQFVGTFHDLLAQLHAETISEGDFETALISAFDSWVGLYASNPVLAQRLVQVLARIDGILLSAGPPDSETGSIGAFAFDTVNQAFYGPKDESGWGDPSYITGITWSAVSGKPSTFPPSSHQHAASDVTSGTFDNARVAVGNVTQHQAALSLAMAQIVGLVDALAAKIETSTVGSANGVAGLDESQLLDPANIPGLSASQTTSGTFADARIAASSVTQHDDEISPLWSNVRATPTTLSGYGITDARTAAQITAEIAASISALVDTAPGTLDTLNELAAALGDDPNFATTITDALATKLASSVWVAATASNDGYMTQEQAGKLAGIESGATADQTGAEIKAAYEGEADTNAYTDAERDKLAAIAEEATKNATDAQLRDRSTHTGTQAQSTIENLVDDLAAKIEAADLAYMSYIKRSSSDNTTDLTTGVTLGWDVAIKEDSGFTVGGAGSSEITFVETGAYDISVMQPYIDTSTEGVGQHNSLDMHAELGGVGVTSTYRGTPVIDADGHREGSVEMEETIDATAGQVLTVHVTRGSGADPLYGIAGEARLIIKRVGGKSAVIAGMTDSEVKTAYENNADTNAYTDAEKAKLASIDAAHYGAPVQSTTELTAIPEAELTDKERRYVEDELSDYFYNATAASGDLAPDDQTGGTGFWFKVAVDGETAASIKTKYESNADTNAFTNAYKAAIDGLPTVISQGEAETGTATDPRIVTALRLRQAANAAIAAATGTTEGKLLALGADGKVDSARLPDGFGGASWALVDADGTMTDKQFEIVSGATATRTRNLPSPLVVGQQYAIKAIGGSARMGANGNTIRHKGVDIGGDLLMADGETAYVVADSTSTVEIM